MKLLRFVFILLIVVHLNLFASLGNEIKLGVDSFSFQVKKLSGSELSVQLTFSLLKFENVKTNNGNFVRLWSEGFVSSTTIGFPELPVISQLIEIPDGTTPEITVVSTKEETIHLNDHGINYKIIPNQMPLSKNNNRDSVPFCLNADFYQSGTFTTYPLVKIDFAGIMRGKQFGKLVISPVKYNPLTDLLQISNNLKLSISFVKKKQERETIKKPKINPVSCQSVINQFFKTTSVPDNGLTANKPLGYIILSDSIFRQTLQPFVSWKRKKGFIVTEVYKGLNGVGTTSAAMRDYLKASYLSGIFGEAPTYLLIVGDVQQIPPFYGLDGQVTDLYYAEYDGNGDYFPELYYGRFSAQDTGQLKAQIDKTLEYEQFLFNDTAFLNKSLLTAGNDLYNAPVYCNGLVNYGTANYFNSANGINAYSYLYPDASSQDAAILSKISNGLSFAIYSGHGATDQWIDPRLAISDVLNLNNSHKYPLMIANACYTCSFGEAVCLGEAMMRGNSNGSIGYIGCTDESFWDEDYYWSIGAGQIVANPQYGTKGLGALDRLFHSHNEPVGKWSISMGEILAAGDMAVSSSASTNDKYYWESYALLGDPSLLPYSKKPAPIHAVLFDSIPPGITNLVVKTEPYAYVAISNDSILYDAQTTESDGSVNLKFPSINKPGKCNLVITKQNFIPLIKTIRIDTVHRAFISLSTLTINDSSDNNNGLPENGEIIEFGLNIKNLGETPAGFVYGKLSSSSTDIQIISDSVFIGSMNANTEKYFNSCFKIKIADSIKDQCMVPFKIELMNDSGQTWDNNYNIPVSSPVIEISGISVNDSGQWNPDNHVDQGETFNLAVKILNKGHANCNNLRGSITAAPPYFSVLNGIDSILNLSVADTGILVFKLKASQNLPYKTLENFNLKLNGAKFSDSIFFTLLSRYTYEDFEEQNFNKFAWINDLIKPWAITGLQSEDGKYSATSGKINNSEKNDLSLLAEVISTGTIEFYVKTSSEKDYDFLKFYIDNNFQGEWSGETGWTKVSFPVTAGLHTFKWEYSKDDNTSSGSDCVWIDDIVFPELSHAGKTDVGVDSILSPNKDSLVTSGQKLKIRIKNSGQSIAGPIPVGFMIDNKNTIRETVNDYIPPKGSIIYTFNSQLGLPISKSFTVKAFTSLLYDSIPVNDTISEIFNQLSASIVDVGVDSILNPTGNTILSNGQLFKIRVRNYGNIKVYDVPVHYIITGENEKSEILQDTIFPRGAMIYEFNSPLEIPSGKSFVIKTFTSMKDDSIFGNDTLYQSFNLSFNNTEYSIQAPFSINPNPAKDLLYVNLNDESFNKIIIYDCTNRELYSKQIQGMKLNQLVIPVSNFKSGVYFILANTKSNSYLKKFVICNGNN